MRKCVSVGLCLLPIFSVQAQTTSESDDPLDDLFAATTVQQAEPDATPAPVDTVSVGEETLPEVAPETKTKPAAAQLEEIVVTARKRRETLQNIPVAVTAFNALQMEQQGFTGLDDIAGKTPGFTFEGYLSGGAHAAPVVRGLAQTFINNRVQNVSFFLDGVYLNRQSMMDIGMIDMERIEVVKGPQNALYGRNAFAGAINYLTKEPTNEPEAYLSLGLGDNERQVLKASYSGPLGIDWIKGKFTVGKSFYEGHTKNNHPVADANPAGPNQRGNLGGIDDLSYSASILFNDMAFAPDLSVKLGYYHADLIHETQPGYSMSGVNAARFGFRFDDQNDLNCNVATVDDISPFPPTTHTGFTTWCGEIPAYTPDHAERRVDGIVLDPRMIGSISETDVFTLNADYDITDNLSVHYLLGYTDHWSYTDGGAPDEDSVAGRGMNTNALISMLDTQQEAAYTFANTTSGRPNSIMDAMSHEVRFDWEINPQMRASFGGYYSTLDDEQWVDLYIMDLCNADSQQNIDNCNTPLNAPNTLGESTILTGAVAYDQYVRQHGGINHGEWNTYDERITAAFGSLTYQFSDTLDATIEARYSEEKKTINRLTDSFMLAYGESITYSPPQDPVVPFGNTLTSKIVVPRDTNTFTNFTPRGIINWAYAPNRMAYASIANGVKAGGFNNADNPDQLTFDQESNWTYEIGSKNKFFNNRLKLNSALYFVDWIDMQGNLPPDIESAGISTSDIITNLGGATTWGFELESSFLLSHSISLDFGGSYSDPKYKSGSYFSAANQESGYMHCDGQVCPTDGAMEGNQVARTSKVQATAGINYFANLMGWDGNMRLNVDYRSRQFISPMNVAWVPGRALLNANMNFTSPDQRWDIGVWGKNLTDEDYAASVIIVMVFNQYMVGKGQPRTFGLNLKYSF